VWQTALRLSLDDTAVGYSRLDEATQRGFAEAISAKKDSALSDLPGANLSEQEAHFIVGWDVMQLNVIRSELRGLDVWYCALGSGPPSQLPPLSVVLKPEARPT
jgi:hypothetical protein